MSNEKNNFHNPERGFNAEALKEAGQVHHDRLKEAAERSVESNSHENAEQARHEALEQAARTERASVKPEKGRRSAERRGPITKREREASFTATMSEVRTHMSPADRAFSKVIHDPTVEKVSDTIGNTVARPNAVLSGSVFAFLFTLTFYLIARFNGYPLSGTETIASFFLGWIVGLVFDYFRMLFIGKK